MDKCLRKVGIFLYDNFPGQTESNNKHLFYSWSPEQNDALPKLWLWKAFPQKGVGM